MKIQGKNKVALEYNAKYSQPYPISLLPIKVGDKTADLVVLTNTVRYIIDGVTYNGSR